LVPATYTAMFGLAWFVVCWAIGFVLAGFSRDDDAMAEPPNRT
jgi:hypothetical protein